MEESFEETNPMLPPTPNPIAPGLGALDQTQIITLATQAALMALQPQCDRFKGYVYSLNRKHVVNIYISNLMGLFKQISNRFVATQ